MPSLSGSLNVTGSVNITGSLTVNGNQIISGSINTSGPITSAGSPVITSTFSGSYATTGSNTFNGAQIITGSLSVTAGGITGSLQGTASFAISSSHASRSLVADKLKVANIGGSGLLFPLMGSNFFGDVDVFTIQSPDYRYNLTINQLVVSSVSGSFTGSLQGTASFAVTASYADKPYSVYTALLSLSSGTFTVTQLENTIGNGSNTSPNDIQWSNPSNGVIRGEMHGAFSNTTNMIIFTPSIRPSGVSYFVAGGLGTFFSGSLQYAPTLTIARHDNDLSSTPNFNDLPIEIRVYN